ncbi:MAG: hypothetical protein K0Q49_20 [Haloplasmataceae bacterium]|jgi:uncharacterized membrane protein YdjX (TVP38/TMEM64 family)|nr:hypothetical protein [Haloplasmataceae bacterium]
MKINQKKLANFAIFSIKILPFILMGLLVILYFLLFQDVSVNDILNFSPKNLFLAFLVIMLLYALKSIIIMIPILILYIVVGTIYPTPMAILINMAGVVVCLTIPYILGRLSGNELLEKLLIKYPKASKVTESSRENAFFFSYMIHVLCPLPGDIVSILEGTMNIPYRKYLIGSVIGSAPYMITCTILGAKITDPLSPVFILSVVVTVVIAIISLLANYFYKKLQKKQVSEV